MAFWSWLNEFVMSSGFAGATAVAAAYVAYRGIGRRISADRDLAREADARQRWWDGVNWVWENREHMEPDLALDTLQTLGGLAQTREQSAYLKAVQTALVESVAGISAKEVPDAGETS
jgi:hypothetical protein